MTIFSNFGTFLGSVLAFIGLCLLIGWLTAFRERLHLAGLAFASLALAGVCFLGGVREGPGVILKWYLVAFAVLALIVALITAISETRRRLSLLAQQRAVREAQFMAQMQAETEKQQTAEE